MLKRSASRNQRSRGVRVKHVLQIVVLVGICFWLIYQVKYSHDKRRELSGKDAVSSSKEEESSSVLKLGRKYLNPRVVENGSRDEKNVEEEEEEEDKHEEGEEERDLEMSKREADRSEETDKNEEEDGQEEGQGKEHEVEEDEENKGEEVEDPEKARNDVDREDDFIDGEKEREEELSEDKESSDGKESSVDKENAEGNEEEEEEEKQRSVEDENQILIEEAAHDEVDRSTHEAREEHYKRDDASSAVAHNNNELISSEMEKFDLEMANESKITSNSTDQYADGGDNGSKSDVKETEMSENGPKLNEAGTERKDKQTDAVKELEDSPPRNLTVAPEDNRANVAITDSNTEELSSSSPSNGTEVILNSAEVQNSTVDGGRENSNATSDGKGTDSVLAAPDAGIVEPTNSRGADQGVAASDQKLSSDKKGEGVEDLRLPSNMNGNKGNNTQHQESEPNETGEVKTS